MQSAAVADALRRSIDCRPSNSPQRRSMRHSLTPQAPIPNYEGAFVLSHASGATVENSVSFRKDASRRSLAPSTLI